MEAKCIASANHEAPQAHCSCGVYAAKSLEQLRHLGYAGVGICGEVYLWGRVVEHSFGWRAQFAYPKAFVLPQESLLFGRFVRREVSVQEVESHLDALTEYGADILMSDGRENICLWTKNSAFNPAGLDWLCQLGATGISVSVPLAILVEGRDPLTLEQNGTIVTDAAEILFTQARFPLSPDDPIVRLIQDRRARVAVIDLDCRSLECATRVIEIIRTVASHLAIFVRGDLDYLRGAMNPMARMLVGANEFLYRHGRDDVMDAFERTSACRTARAAAWRRGGWPPDGSMPPMAPVWVPLGEGPRTMSPRGVALAI
jgi:hypothetical protein